MLENIYSSSDSPDRQTSFYLFPPTLYTPCLAPLFTTTSFLSKSLLIHNVTNIIHIHALQASIFWWIIHPVNGCSYLLSCSTCIANKNGISYHILHSRDHWPGFPDSVLVSSKDLTAYHLLSSVFWAMLFLLNPSPLEVRWALAIQRH